MRDPSVQCVNTRSPTGERDRDLSASINHRVVIKSSRPASQATDDESPQASCLVPSSKRGGRRSKRQLLLQEMKQRYKGLRKGLLKGFVHEGASSTTEEETGTVPAKPEQRTTRGAHEGAPHAQEFTADCLLMSAQHYVVTGSVGVSAKVTHPTPIVVDTGSGFNVIRRDVLPVGWQMFITANKELPRLGDASGNALQVAHEVLLRVRFGDALYQVSFLVVEHLSCPFLVRTQFTNRHVEAIWCIKGKMQFTHDTLPIIGSGTQEKPWRDEKAKIVERATLENGETVATGDESAQLTKIRLTKAINIPPHTQLKVQVSTLLQGLIVTEPKHDVTERYNVRVMNSVHEVDASMPFHILVTNFSAVPRFLPKGMVIAYASRSPLAFISLQGGAAQELCSIHNIFVTSDQSKDPSPAFADDDPSAVATGALSSAPQKGSTPAPEAALASAADLEALVPPESQQVHPVIVEDMPYKDDDEESEAPRTAPETEREEEDWREKVDLSHLENKSLKRRVMKMLA